MILEKLKFYGGKIIVKLRRILVVFALFLPICFVDGFSATVKQAREYIEGCEE